MKAHCLQTLPFPRNVQRTPTTGFIRAIRLYKAKELLQNESLNVAQAAYEVGFTDPSYFSRKFSEEFGTYPKSFMRR